VCRTCWEKNGGHSHTSPEIEKAVVLIHRIWEDNEVSMPLHVQIDDWGIEGVWEPWPDHKDAVSEDCWNAAVELSALMNSLSIEDRCAAMGRADYYIMKIVEGGETE
jgi:hypothetical protein